MAQAQRQKKPLSVNSFSVKVTIGTQTLESYFSKCSSIKKTYNTGTYSDGQSNIVYTLPSSVQYDDITLSKPLTVGDETLVSSMLQANSPKLEAENAGTEYVTVDIQPMYRDGYLQQAIGGSIHAKYCVVKSVQFPEIDTAGDGVAMVEFVLSPGYIASEGSTQFWSEPGELIQSTTA
jgi:hypothetical protein